MTSSSRTASASARTLLAVDLGLNAGLACFALDDAGAGALVWYRSQSFGTITRLKRAIPLVLDECAQLAALVVEGDRHLGELWGKAAAKRGAHVLVVSPETWREALLLPREQRNGSDAKAAAMVRARAIIEAAGAPRPKTPLIDDVAEAICIGAWGCGVVAGFGNVSSD